jgi:hypothetical protein
MLERHKPRRVRATVVALVAAGAGLVAGMQIGGSPAGSPTAAPSHDTQAMPGMSHGPAAPPGAGSQAVYISPARQQLVGVRTAPVTRQTVQGTIRTVGTLAYDETRPIDSSLPRRP